MNDILLFVGAFVLGVVVGGAVVFHSVKDVVDGWIGASEEWKKTAKQWENAAEGWKKTYYDYKEASEQAFLEYREYTQERVRGTQRIQ